MELGDKVNGVAILFLFAGLVLGVVAYFGYTNLQSSPGIYAEDLASTLEQSSGQNLEVVKTSEENGLYRIELRNENDQLLTYYMTKDGQRVMQEASISDFNNLRRTISAQADFSSCLQDRNVVMFGNQTQRATVAQIQLLGGLNQVSGIYADVNNPEVLQQASQIGVQRIPAFVYNDSAVQGVQSIQDLESFTGCSYNLSG